MSMDASFRHPCKTHQRPCIDGTDRSPLVVKLPLKTRGIQGPEWGQEPMPAIDASMNQRPQWPINCLSCCPGNWQVVKAQRLSRLGFTPKIAITHCAYRS